LCYQSILSDLEEIYGCFGLLFQCASFHAEMELATWVSAVEMFILAMVNLEKQENTFGKTEFD